MTTGILSGIIVALMFVIFILFFVARAEQRESKSKTERIKRLEWDAKHEEERVDHYQQQSNKMDDKLAYLRNEHGIMVRNEPHATMALYRADEDGAFVKVTQPVEDKEQERDEEDRYQQMADYYRTQIAGYQEKGRYLHRVHGLVVTKDEFKGWGLYREDADHDSVLVPEPKK